MFHKIGEHTWYLEPDARSDRPSLGYIRGEKLAFAADAGASKNHVRLFYSCLEKDGLPLPDITGISHYHWDHSYGAPYVHGITLASDLCNDHLKKESAYDWTPKAAEKRLKTGDDIWFCYCMRQIEYPDPAEIKVVPADISVSGNITIDLGGVHVNVIYCAGPHSEDHLMFYVPEDRVLYISDANTKDLFKNEWAFDAAHPETLQDRIREIPHFVNRLAPFVNLMDGLDFEICVPGHAEGLQSKAEVMAEMQKYLK
ncbi:MAG: MBL fold metallo-hydrolase [Clostridia bacterium]|nr:MBL fold metallo-hydrolase [Clostridia bacterium]